MDLVCMEYESRKTYSYLSRNYMSYIYVRICDVWFGESKL